MSRRLAAHGGAPEARGGGRPPAAQAGRALGSPWPAAVLLLLPALLAAAEEEVQLEPAGIHFPGTRFQREVRLANPGPEPWRILATKKNCACAFVSQVPALIPPGGSATLAVVLTAGDEPGPERLGIFFRIAAGPREFVRQVVVEATVADYLELPGSLVRLRSATAATLTLARGAHPDRWTSVRVDGSACSDRFAAALRPREGGWDLDLAVQPGIHRGEFRGRLAFIFADEAGRELPHRQHLDVCAQMPGALRAEPPTALVGAVPEGAQRELELALEPADGPVPAIECSDPERLRAEPVADEGGARHLRLVFTARPPVGPASGEVRLLLPGGEVVHIPYAASVAPAQR